MLNNFTENEFDLYINATMNPDKQMGKVKEVPEGTVLSITHIAQEETTRTASGQPAVVTSLVDVNGVSYQTLSDFVDKFFNNVARMKPVETWKDNPVTIQTVWKEGKQGNWLSVKLA